MEFDINKARASLLRFKSRFPGASHFGDCDIYRSLQVYGTAPCTCGFLYELEKLYWGLGQKINPHFFVELARKDPQTEGTPKTEEEARKMLEEVFGHIEVSEKDEEEAKVITWLEWELIEEVFGKQFREEKEIESLGR